MLASNLTFQIARSPARLPALAVLVLACAACAHRGAPPQRDATSDPEFQAALRDARREFPRQRDVLEAGLYETFVPPESLPAGPETPPAAADEDPSTEELLRSLPAGDGPSREPAEPGRLAEPVGGGEMGGSADVGGAGGDFTIQVGAFGGEAAAGERAVEMGSLAPDLPVEVRRGGDLVRVFLGRFATRGEAEVALRELLARGLGAAWVTRLER